MTEPRIVSWFSCGAASAVATKLAIRECGDRVVPAYCDPGAEDEDNQRFLRDCEEWFGVPVQRLKSEDYDDVEQVWEKRRFMAGINGAPCTAELKVKPRVNFQRVDDVHVFGYTADSGDVARADRMRSTFFELSIWTPLIERGLTKAACRDLLMRAGIQEPRTYALGFPNANCFSGDTQFITDQGVKRLDEAVGRTVCVRTGGKGSGWKAAEVHQFGQQELYRVRAYRGPREKDIFCTANHRWFRKRYTKGAIEECETTDLKPGDKLPTIFGSLHARIRPSAFGIAHGIVFGDGSVSGATTRGSARLVLCGEKDKELIKYFPHQPRKEVDAGWEINDLPRLWKDRPCFNESDSYLYGWLAGYFAADGCADKKGRYFLSSANLSNLEFARDVAVRLGIGVNGITRQSRKGYGKEETDIYNLSLVGDTLREDFFLIQRHRERFTAKNTRRPHPWVVTSIERTGRVEPVYCVVEPETGTFVLEDNILTGNCIGCPKASSPAYWALVRQHYPETFKRRAKLSREIGARLARVNGERVFIDEIPDNQPTTQAEAPACDFLCAMAAQDLEDNE